jgi:hypothetical protein
LPRRQRLLAPAKLGQICCCIIEINGLYLRLRDSCGYDQSDMRREIRRPERNFARPHDSKIKSAIRLLEQHFDKPLVERMQPLTRST